MLTQEQFNAMPAYDQAGNPEKLKNPESVVKAITVTDFSDTNIYYRDKDGALSSIPRKVLGKKRLALGDVLSFDVEMKLVASTSEELDAKTKKLQPNDGTSSRRGSNDRKPLTMF